MRPFSYNATTEGKVYLFTGSKVTGGFCVTAKKLLEPSKLGHILTDNPALQNYQTTEGEFIKYSFVLTFSVEYINLFII